MISLTQTAYNFIIFNNIYSRSSLTKYFQCALAKTRLSFCKLFLKSHAAFIT